MEFFDTHCHVHEIVAALTPVHKKWFSDGRERTGASVVEAAREANVSRLLVIGTTLADSELAVSFAQSHDGVWASVGIHPHEAKEHTNDAVRDKFRALASQAKVVAIGECGLDYFYDHSSKADQTSLLRLQLDVARELDLPVSFHVREAFDDFWPIFEGYEELSGVLHSFTDSEVNLHRALGNGLYIGVNGIATFTRDTAQREIYRIIPQHKMLLETDAPFLTPSPFRGTVCEPKHVVRTAEFLAQLRDESLESIARVTTASALKLLGINQP